MQRDFQLNRLNQSPDKLWDIVVIGGGATGLGIAVDAASRGYRTVLLEQSDFAKGTSSRSTKLVHGGVRYLAQGDVSLVLEALHERGLLRRNAPHLVKNQAFIIPNYDWWEGPFYNIGMKVYDMMAGRLGLGPSEKISREETLEAIPNLDEKHLNGGVIYYDGQFDDSRLAVNLAQTAVENEAIVLNYMRVTGLLKDSSNLVCGVEAVDTESGEPVTVRSRVVINATGVFVDTILSMDDAGAEALVRPSQGIHFVLDKSFLQGDSAIMIPKTSDGRVLFAVPWHDKVVVGTTDTPLAIKDICLEPRALAEEIEFILTTAAQYLKKDPRKSDVLSVFAGLRPLAAQQDSQRQSTKEISRSHRLMVSLSGLITITGGKWTTYRKMAEDTVNKAWMVGGLPKRKCVTESMPIHGYVKNTHFDSPGYFYGSDRIHINAMIQTEPSLGQLLHPDYEYNRAQVVWAVRNEMARTVEDFLSRRIRMLLLDARASMAMAPEVANIMARELKRGPAWIRSQLADYQALAQGYILS
ncbi:glycerol-3-phosphate dehydrogenase/oxidase [Desulfobacula sp.]|uniref:glycerol-3-phosphate dehydrogenase/oxidase n=1 Tax=Desulfobacula sp. TaxID=2593537 RepID=UPI0026273BF2|nr:glycerol-3-phosphate dehydrogenase/oxidase [Desulfobacula sp.]